MSYVVGTHGELAGHPSSVLVCTKCDKVLCSAENVTLDWLQIESRIHVHDGDAQAVIDEFEQEDA